MENKYMKLEELLYYQACINKQEGQKYPCSNQIVVCGIFTEDRDKAVEFMADKKVERCVQSPTGITWYLENGERWMWCSWNMNHRGKRFYKIAVDKNIDRNLFEMFVMPYSGFYCCSMEII